jgi:uncharacterized protein
MRFTPSHFKLRSHCRPLPIFILFLAVMPVVPLHAEQWQKLNPQGYVNDFAGVLNAPTVERLTQLSTTVDKKAKAQIAVVTIRTLEGDTVEDFANHLFQKWGVGAKGTDRGVMVLLVTADHKYWTEVGYGLEPILPDGKVGEFGRNMVPLLRQGDYNSAVMQMTRQIAEVIAKDSHVSLDNVAQGSSASSILPILIFILFVVIMFGVPITALLFFVYLISRPSSPLVRHMSTVRAPVTYRAAAWSGGGFAQGGGGGGFWGSGGGGGFGGFGGGSSGGGGAGGSW